MAIAWIIVLCVYFSINLLLSIWIYRAQKPFYEPKIIVDENNNKINLHEKYHPFKKYDQLSFFRILFGTNVLLWWRFTSAIIGAAFCSLTLKIILCVKKDHNREWIKKTMKFYSTWVLLSVAGRIVEGNSDCKELYKSYFGQDYEFTEDYSLIVSNHTSWIDIMCYLHHLQCGFIAKDEVENIPFVGIIAQQMGGMFVKRDDAENRHLILEQIENRQQQFMKKETDKPLLVFAEGTVTSGKHMMKFKKGAFHSLLPIKPSIINTTLNKYHVSVGAAGLFPHFLKTLCYLYNNIEITELPVMKPNDFMYENYSKLHPEITEKWEIYAEVAREIMCKASGMTKTEMTFRESIEYSNLVKGIKKSNKLLQSNIADNSKTSN